LKGKIEQEVVPVREPSIVDDMPEILPILPLRDIVIFPYMIFPVLVGREQSIKAANYALENTKYIFLSTQKKSSIEDPKEGDIFIEGTIAKIVQILKLPNGLMKILVDGLLQGRMPTSGIHIRIEAYDIAHMGGKNMVGVMTVVLDGEVDKNEYRKFKIKTQKNSNDTGALKEVLERRLAHTEWTYPALVVVDGGVAQINAAKKVLSKIKSSISIVSVLKDEKHKPKAIMGDEKMGLKYKREIL